MAELWLPRSYHERQRAGYRRGYLTYVCWSEVSDTPLTFDDICRLLTQVRTESILTALSAIGIVLTNNPRDINDLHARHHSLAREICDAEIADRVIQLIKPNGRDVLAHDTQILLAIKLAILHGQPGAGEMVPKGILGKILLGINNLLERGECPSFSPHATLIALALRQQAALRNEQLRYFLARYYDILVARAPHITKHHFDFEQVLQGDLGIGIEEYFALAFMQLIPFLDLKEAADFADIDFVNVIQQYQSRLQDPRLRMLCQDLFSTEIADIRIQLQQEAQQIHDWSFVPIKQTPFFRTTNGSALPFFLPFVYETVAMGAYWKLLSIYSKRDHKQGVRTFAGHVGILFQDYITDLLTRTDQPSPANGARFFSEHDIVQASPNAPKGQNPPFDGALLCGDTLVIFEMGTLALTQRGMEQADPSQFADLVKRDFLRKVSKQLNPAIDGIKGGVWNVPGLNHKEIRHILPVLVLLHPYPQNVATLQPLFEAGKPRQSIAFGSNLLTATVYEPQILTAEDLEMMEPLISSGQIQISKILLDKLNHAEGISMRMKSFLLTVLGLNEIPNEYLRTQFSIIADRFSRVLERFTTTSSP